MCSVARSLIPGSHNRYVVLVFSEFVCAVKITWYVFSRYMGQGWGRGSSVMLEPFVQGRSQTYFSSNRFLGGGGLVITSEVGQVLERPHVLPTSTRPTQALMPFLG